jgi:hypothetical protein
MISRAIVQSAIVLMNRRMKAERRPAAVGFVPVCSSVAGMPCIMSKEGALRKRERALRRECGWASSGRVAVKITAILRPPRRSAYVAHRTYYGVGDGLGKVASVRGAGVGELVSTAEDGVGELASAEGKTAPPDISNLRCFWFCNFSSPGCL